MNRRWAVLLGIAGTLNLAAGETRVKDVARVGGARDLELVGYGLVTGLRGTGDRPGSGPAAQSLVNLLNRLGVAASPQELQSSNIAAVAVTARVPAFSRPGAASDARVSSLGNASRLEGGTLLLTALLGVDGKAYATAQGRLAEEPEAGDDRRGAGSAGGATTAFLPSGVLLEKPLTGPAAETDGRLAVTLDRPDAVTAERIAQAVQETLKTPSRATDPGRVEVEIPEDFREDPVGFAARVERVTVTPDDAPRVVLNERTGTVIAGQGVRIAPVAISHGGVKIEIGGGPARAEADVTSLVDLLSGLGVRPRDVVVIFQMLKRLGALKAELVLM